MCSPKTMPWIMLPLVVGFFFGSILVRTQIDVVSDLVTVNGGGATGRALVVYHPGLSSFQADVTRAFVDGLVEGDWHCDLATASRAAPAELDGYDLIVLGAPTYAWKPASPIVRYVRRVGDLGGVATILIMTSAGPISDVLFSFAELVEGANGRVVETLEIRQAAPNEEIHGLSDALEIARRAGAGMAPP
jgi:hypothetical protein